MSAPTEVAVESAVTVVERIMTQHWDLVACPCWVCQEGHAAGCRPREEYLAHHHPGESRPQVSVEWVESL